MAESDSDLNSQEIADRAKDAIPGNTERNTKWAEAVYTRWARRRASCDFVRAHITDYSAGDEKDLSSALKKFYAEVHTQEGPGFTPSSMQCLRAGLQRRLAMSGIEIDIATGPAFKQANIMFKATKRRYSMSGDNRQAGKQKKPIDPRDQELIRTYFVSAGIMRSPIVLQLFIFYALSMVFGYRGREVWRQLKKESFVERVNPTTGKKRYTIDQSVMEKNYQLRPSSKELEITDDEEEGVHLFSAIGFYLSKLDPRQTAFFKNRKLKNRYREAKQPGM